MRARLRIAVDIGGTFTDGVIEDADGGIRVAKLLTTPDDPGEAVSAVVAALLAQATGHAPADVRDVVHATTLVTNTLIERRGATVALIVTEGTEDVPDIARENRYDLYDLAITFPTPLVPPERRFAIAARMDADGTELTPPDARQLADIAARVSASGAEAVGVCLLHGYADDRHERAVGDALARHAGGVAVSLSSAIAPEPREYERMSTVAANAYVQPLMTRYLSMLDARLRDAGIVGPLRIMLSAGGFSDAAFAAGAPIQLLESGPAAGVLSAANAGAAAGARHVLAFDMGGTTAKACVVADGEPPVAHAFEAARVRRFRRGSGLPVLVPSLDLIEIGAGGGSIASVNAVGTLAVGPRSAGAVPGPACYGLGGTDATVTDADLALGYLDPARFLGGEMVLDVAAARDALARLGARLGVDAVAAAWGICSVVNETMAAAARVHIAEKGHDPRRFTLVATGGAGPVHAIDVARRLRIPRVICPIAAGAGSCLGLLAAAPRAERAWARACLLHAVPWETAAAALAALRADAASELDRTGADPTSIEWLLALRMRYDGQGHDVDVTLPWPERLDASIAPTITAAFEARYRHLYGALVPGAQPEIAIWRLVGRGPRATRRFDWADGRDEATTTAPRTHRDAWLPLAETFGRVPVFDRYALPPGTTLAGPAILEERESTLVVPFPAAISVLEDRAVAITLETPGA